MTSGRRHTVCFGVTAALFVLVLVSTLAGGLVTAIAIAALWASAVCAGSSYRVAHGDPHMPAVDEAGAEGLRDELAIQLHVLRRIVLPAASDGIRPTAARLLVLTTGAIGVGAAAAIIPTTRPADVLLVVLLAATITWAGLLTGDLVAVRSLARRH